MQIDAWVFGSVALKAYLPDGDIDFSLFQRKGQTLRDTWTALLHAALLQEHANPANSNFHVSHPQVINAEARGHHDQSVDVARRFPLPLRTIVCKVQGSGANAAYRCSLFNAIWQLYHDGSCVGVGLVCSVSYYAGPQVKLVKFLVNELVIDVSFETLGGLCAVNFLQDMDTHIARNSLFKRSIILVNLPPAPLSRGVVHVHHQPWSWSVLSVLSAKLRFTS